MSGSTSRRRVTVEEDQTIVNPLERKICRSFVESGKCNYGENCVYQHPKRKTVKDTRENKNRETSGSSRDRKEKRTSKRPRHDSSPDEEPSKSASDRSHTAERSRKNVEKTASEVADSQPKQAPREENDYDEAMQLVKKRQELRNELARLDEDKGHNTDDSEASVFKRAGKKKKRSKERHGQRGRHRDDSDKDERRHTKEREDEDLRRPPVESKEADDDMEESGVLPPQAPAHVKRKKEKKKKKKEKERTSARSDSPGSPKKRKGEKEGKKARSKDDKKPKQHSPISAPSPDRMAKRNADDLEHNSPRSPQHRDRKRSPRRRPASPTATTPVKSKDSKFQFGAGGNSPEFSGGKVFGTGKTGPPAGSTKETEPSDDRRDGSRSRRTQESISPEKKTRKRDKKKESTDRDNMQRQSPVRRKARQKSTTPQGVDSAKKSRKAARSTPDLDLRVATNVASSPGHASSASSERRARKHDTDQRQRSTNSPRRARSRDTAADYDARRDDRGRDATPDRNVDYDERFSGDYDERKSLQRRGDRADRSERTDRTERTERVERGAERHDKRHDSGVGSGEASRLSEAERYNQEKKAYERYLDTRERLDQEMRRGGTREYLARLREEADEARAIYTRIYESRYGSIEQAKREMQSQTGEKRSDQYSQYADNSRSYDSRSHETRTHENWDRHDDRKSRQGGYNSRDDSRSAREDIRGRDDTRTRDDRPLDEARYSDDVTASRGRDDSRKRTRDDNRPSPKRKRVSSPAESHQSGREGKEHETRSRRGRDDATKRRHSPERDGEHRKRARTDKDDKSTRGEGDAERRDESKRKGGDDGRRSGSRGRAGHRRKRSGGDRRRSRDRRDDRDDSRRRERGRDGNKEEVKDTKDEKKDAEPDAADEGQGDDDANDDQSPVTIKPKDVLEIDWASLAKDLHAERKITVPQKATKRFLPGQLFASLGVSKAFAGEELYAKIEKLCDDQLKEDHKEQVELVREENSKLGENDTPISEPKAPERFQWRSGVAQIHCTLASRIAQRRNLLTDVGPYRRALCARRDLGIRRQLCKLNKEKVGVCTDFEPVKIDPEVHKLSVELLKDSRSRSIQ